MSEPDALPPRPSADDYEELGRLLEIAEEHMRLYEAKLARIEAMEEIRDQAEAVLFQNNAWLSKKP